MDATNKVTINREEQRADVPEEANASGNVSEEPTMEKTDEKVPEEEANEQPSLNLEGSAAQATGPVVDLLSGSSSRQTEVCVEEEVPRNVEVPNQEVESSDEEGRESVEQEGTWMEVDAALFSSTKPEQATPPEDERLKNEGRGNKRTAAAEDEGGKRTKVSPDTIDLAAGWEESLASRPIVSGPNNGDSSLPRGGSGTNYGAMLRAIPKVFSKPFIWASSWSVWGKASVPAPAPAPAPAAAPAFAPASSPAPAAPAPALVPAPAPAREGEGDMSQHFRLTDSCELVLHRGNITTWSVDGQTDAIVNAANEAMLGGGGVDGAIHRAAGKQLYQACKELPCVAPGVRCPTGEAVITPGFKLPASRIIHTVGPVYYRSEAEECAQLLRSSYQKSLELARREGIKYIAFPAISCGIYHYPKNEAARLALEVSMEESEGIQEVHFVLFEPSTVEAWMRAVQDAKLEKIRG